MAPKTKKGKKAADDDWEADLGESVDPIAKAAEDAAAAENEEDDGEEGGGGLLAAMRKNRERKKKKGKHVEDFVEGEDLAAINGAEELPTPQAPEEATLDDEEFALPVRGKAKGGKKDESQSQGEDEDNNADGTVKSKKQKEKEKKEREKLRKKENVSMFISSFLDFPSSKGDQY
jgi:translation initiation factor 5B